MKLRLNPWPGGIVVAFILFIAGTLALIVMAVSNRMDLVAPDYYERELQYDQQRASLERAQRLPDGARVVFDPARQSITLALPADHARREARGEITLFRPSAAGLDRRLDLRLAADGTQVLDASALQPGLWKIRVSWQVAGEEFYLDEKVVVTGA